MDTCKDQGDAEVDPGKRVEIYKRCQLIIYTEAYVGGGYMLASSVARGKAVNGLSRQFLSMDLRRVWVDK
jgi:hypothetical protein